MSVILIGGAGFVGSRITSDCAELSAHVLDKRYDRGHPGYVDITIPETLCSKIAPDDVVVLLAAEHRDDVKPTSMYYTTNVEGTSNVLREMDKVGCQRLVFTSSVAVYGLNKECPSEGSSADPFNHYGKSKWQAEKVIKEWYEKDPESKSVNIIRPTVIFGEKNRGNVYNLLRQIASGKFLMIGRGENKKSMAYVGNVVDFIRHCVMCNQSGFNLFNYVDKEDMTMHELLAVIQENLGKKLPSLRLPIWAGYLVGYMADFCALITRKKFPVSSVRVKKFVATTEFDASKVHSGSWSAPYGLVEGMKRTLDYEFVQKRSDDEQVFHTE